MTRHLRNPIPSAVAWRASVGRRLNSELLALDRTVPGLYEAIVVRTNLIQWNEAVDIEIRRPGAGARSLMRMISLSGDLSDVECEE